MELRDRSSGSIFSHKVDPGSNEKSKIEHSSNFFHEFFSFFPCCFPTQLFFFSSLSLGVQPYILRAYILYFNFDWRTTIVSMQSGDMSERGWFKFFRKHSTWVTVGTYVVVVGITVIVTGICYSLSGLDPTTFYMPLRSDCLPLSIKVFIGIQCGVFVLVVLVEIYLLYRVRDAFAFKWELLTTCLAGLPVLVVWVITKVNAALNAEIPSFVWSTILFLVCVIASIAIPAIHLIRTRKTLHHGDSGSFVSMESVPSHGSVADFLLLVLDSPILLESLKTSMVIHWSVENLLFFAGGEAVSVPGELA